MQSRSRRLTDAEIFAFWRATGRMGYPVGPVYRMLLLTGLRLNEAAQMSWPEVHGNTIVIPASRMKGREGKAREHLVPLSSAAQEVIASLPRIRNGPFLFSYSAGKRPLAMTGPIKGDLDRRMLRTLKAMARRRGEDHHAVSCRIGSTTICAASSAPVCRHCASRTTSRKPCLRTGRPASSAPMTCMNIRTRSARRWRHGRSGLRPSSTRRLPRRPPKGRQAAGAAAMMARQIAARGRLCAGEGWPVSGSPALRARCTAR